MKIYQKLYDTDIGYSFFNSKVAIVSFVIFLLIAFCSFFAEFVSPYDPFDPINISHLPVPSIIFCVPTPASISSESLSPLVKKLSSS